MNLDLQPLGPIAPGGTVLRVTGQYDDALWLASPAGAFHFDGTTWRVVMRGIPFWRVNTVLAVGKSVWVAGMPGGMVRSANNGKSWHYCRADQIETPIISLAASPNYRRDRVLLAGTHGDGILRSIDGGQHWELSNFGLRDFSVFEMVTAPAWDKYEYAFAITDGNIYQSPNGGRAWRRADLGKENVQPLSLAVSPNFVTDQTIFAGCETGELLVSTDAGRSFQQITDKFEAIEALTVTPEGALIVDTPEGICRFDDKNVTNIRSADCIVSKVPSSVLGFNAINNALYAGLVDGLYHSVDDGRSWQPVPNLSARRFVWCLTPGPDMWVAGGPEEGVWRSENRGQSWQQLWADTPVLGITATITQIWVSSPAGVVTSIDGGATWENILTSDVPITALAVENETVWAGSHDSRLWYLAFDKTRQVIDTPFTGSQLLGIFAKKDVLVTAVWEAETGKVNLWRTEDNGTKWSKWFSHVSKPITPQVLFADDTGNEPLVGLGTDIHRFIHGTWQRLKVTSQDAPITSLLRVANNTLAALTDQLILSTTVDNWSPVETNINGNPIAAIQYNENQIVIMAGDGRIWIGQP